MAFGKGSGQSQFPEGTQFYYVDIRTKNLPAPVFRIQTRTPEKQYVIVDDSATHIKGDIVGISNRETKNPKANNALIRSVSLVMEDKEAKHAYFIQIPHSYLGWSILNALAGLESYDGVSIQLYQSKPREGNDKTYPSVAVRQSEELVYGKFKNEELPEVPKVQVGDEVHADKSKRTAFFIGEVDKLSRSIRLARSKVPANAGAADDNGAGTDDLDEDVPF